MRFYVLTSWLLHTGFVVHKLKLPWSQTLNKLCKVVTMICSIYFLGLDTHPKTDNNLFKYKTENIAFTTTELISKYSLETSIIFLIHFFTNKRYPKFLNLITPSSKITLPQAIIYISFTVSTVPPKSVYTSKNLFSTLFLWKWTLKSFPWYRTFPE